MARSAVKSDVDDDDLMSSDWMLSDYMVGLDNVNYAFCDGK